MALEAIFLELLGPKTRCCHVLKPRAGGAAIIKHHLLIRFVVVEDKTPGDLQFEAGTCGGLHKSHDVWGHGVFFSRGAGCPCGVMKNSLSLNTLVTTRTMVRGLAWLGC